MASPAPHEAGRPCSIGDRIVSDPKAAQRCERSTTYNVDVEDVGSRVLKQLLHVRCFEKREIEGSSVATIQILPIHIRISRKIPRQARSGTMELVGGLDRLWLTLRCPWHAWSWPRANREERLEGYDAHQTCYKCTARRMFDTGDWHAGPVYTRRLPAA